jgi:hypothetical protein
VLHTWGSALTHHPHVHGIVPGGGSVGRWRSMDCLPAGLLPVRARAISPVPTPLPRRTRPCPRGRLLALLRRAHGTRRITRLRALARATPLVRMGRLRQAPVCRPRRRARLSVALHAPGGHLQQSLA